MFELLYRFLKQSIVLTNHTTCMRIDADDLVDSLATVGLTSVVASELERCVNAPIWGLMMIKADLIQFIDEICNIFFDF